MATTNPKASSLATRSAVFVELFDEMEQRAAAVFMRHGCAEDSAARGAAEFREEIADLWGGQNIYIPRDASKKASELRAQIIADFDGTNVHEIARKYRVTEVHVYGILKRDREERRESGPLATGGNKAPHEAKHARPSDQPGRRITMAERISRVQVKAS